MTGKKSLEIETDYEISTFLALIIICKASSFKIMWSSNFYIHQVRITFLVSTKYKSSPPLGHYR